MPPSPKSWAPSMTLGMPGPLCWSHQSTLVTPFSSQDMYMSALNRAPGWVSSAMESLVSVTTIGTFAGSTFAYCWTSDLSAETAVGMSVVVASICAVVMPV